MMAYCLKCKKNTKNVDANRMKTKNGRFVVDHQNVMYVAVENQIYERTRSRRIIE